MKMLFKNLRFRLLLALFVILFAFFYGFGWSVVYTMKKSQERSLEASLKAYAKDLQHDYLERNVKGQIIDFEELKEELDEVKEEFDIPVLYAQLLSYKIASQNPTIIAQSRDLKGESLKLTSKLIENILNDPSQIYFAETRNETLSKHKIYIGTLFLGMHDNQMLLLQCAMPYDKRTPEIEKMEETLWIGLSILLALVLFLASLLLSTSLKNVQKVTDKAKKLSIQDNYMKISKTHIAHEIDDLIETFNTLLEHLQYAYAQVKEFGQNASHELKTPLTIMQGEIEIGLKKERSTQEYQHILHKVAKEVTHLHEVIEKILFLSSSSKNDLMRHFSEVYVDEILMESITEKKEKAQTRGITLVVDALEPLSIQSNALLLKMVVNNLIDNAIKYALGNSSVHLALHGKELRIVNKGTLIDDTELEHIFEPFYRGKRAKKHAQGSGLGLAIVKNILDAHHAHITLTQEKKTNTIILTVQF
ncbi:sensor histidine kinase [Sulfurospirillum barnesii]|uniref:histidine kinase n=1 Tax=Sulfurospirillum barnesii (strain ATCC 700032 / DSM 10660 / SES-3) TaxID=760154 RepID=I3XZQ7_SULBS|nr:ATP-binding protein [Sulfurospirillum barnesii]AFL69431.1 signal transduction histidine kinase [Sulfurospirillum barnesii SES-3]